MSAVLHDALVAALRAHPPLVEGVTAIFDAPPVRSAVPYAVVAESVVADWSTKDLSGVEARVAIELHDAGEAAVRLRGLAGQVADAVAAMPRTIGGGWRIVTATFVRQRIVRGRGDAWVASVEFRMRMLREG
jgi:hypothetical protein